VFVLLDLIRVILPSLFNHVVFLFGL
jgi:hypothetical protein